LNPGTKRTGRCSGTEGFVLPNANPRFEAGEEVPQDRRRAPLPEKRGEKHEREVLEIQ
jgi:hypothetical protein